VKTDDGRSAIEATMESSGIVSRNQGAKIPDRRRLTTSTSISTYDTFVNTQGLSGITVNGSSLAWQALGLTPPSNPLTDTTRYSSQANASQ
jgi:hypothetical protein